MKFVLVLIPIILGLCLADVPTNIPEIDDFEAIKERCDKKGGAGTYEKLKKAKDETQTCMQSLIDVETVKNEIEVARKTGSMDEVFFKYCKKRPEMRECLKKTVDALEPCLEENERKAVNTTQHVMTQIGDFACFKDGDRIAMFVAEGGVKCLKDRAEGIKNCFNQTIKFNPATFSPNSIPTFTIDKKKCDDLTAIQECVVKDLEDNCENTTPANIVESLFRFVKKSACKDIKRRRRSISLKRQIRSAIAKTQEEFRAEMEAKLMRTCKKNGNEQTHEKIKATFNETRTCMNKHRIFVTPYNIYRSHFANCTANSRKLIEDCLPEEGKYYPDFVLEVLQSFFKFGYDNIEKLIVAKPENMEFGNCVRVLSKDEPNKEVMGCFSQTSQGDVIEIPPKAELCAKIIDLDACLTNIVKNTCIKDIRITKFTEDLFKALEVPCKQKTISDNEP